MLISIMAAIWESRKKWSHGDQGYNPANTIEFVSETLNILKKKKAKVSCPLCTWHGPGPGVIKLNSDGAIRAEEGRASTGGVATDSVGFRGVWCRLYQGITDPLIIETLAVRDAVLFASDQHFDHIIIETDCSKLVRLLLERRNHRAMFSSFSI
ncbi:hypothetical protein BRADI_4g24297v3 [Brachypodium distachyon]|uniref:RNase H type-1 domain-containing protein n=1 Tax=Brachypodium distachyon TaxID=15368 RepID=A0A0Q3PIQ1_BRADI|nr:hypothetical protein BRADI_4g24297v3 [Brachypodium distachyon]